MFLGLCEHLGVPAPSAKVTVHSCAGAAFYGNEAVVGAGLADFIAAGRRSELFITTKVWNTHHKPQDAR